MEFKARKPKKKSAVIWTRLLIIIAIVGVIGFAGYKIGFHYLSNKMMNEMADQILTTEEVEALKNDPAVQQIISDNSQYFDQKAMEALQGSVSSEVNGDGASQGQPDHAASGSATDKNDESDGASKPATDKPVSGDQLVVKTKDEAADLLIGKFSMKELTGLADKAKDGLTPEEKQNIKDTLLSRLSADEYNSVKIIALMEIMKREEAK